MAVRKTESRLPGGFSLENAKKLGHAQNEPSRNYILVSYLNDKIRQRNEEKERFIRNSYVVFVKEGASVPTSYECLFEFFIKDQIDPIQYSSTPKDYGYFDLDADEISAVDEKVIEKIKVTITLKGINPERSISLEHKILDLDSDIEALFEGDSETKNASGGNPAVTRLLGNDYRPYLNDKSLDVPRNLLAAVIYLYQLNNSIESQLENMELWEAYLNQGKESSELMKTPLGIVHIRPYLLAMFLKKLDGTENGKEDEGSISKQNWDCNTQDHDDYEDQVFNSFKADVADEKKIDIFNLLRFPKSAIRTCAAYLVALQRNSPDHPEWKPLGNEELMENEEAVKTIVSEYKRGPSHALEDFTEIGEKVFGTMFTKYIETIIAKDYIEFHIVKIKVLDIRAGQPLINKRVRKLVVRGVNGADKKYFGVKNEDEFLYDRDKIPNYSSIRSAQIALLRMGYAPPAVDRTDKTQENLDKWCDGGWGAETAAAYNNYWSDRLLDNSLDQPADKSPDSYYLSRIKDEYNSRAYTNDEGVLEVKIPRNFLENREIYIDISFWEFPISLEELKDDDRTNPITRPENGDGTPDSSSTKFIVSWIDSQKMGWNDYLRPDGTFDDAIHFGWSVKDKNGDCASNLKVWQRLVVKADTNPFEEWDENLLSKFYDVADEHFVLFAMEWCQPTWDEFEDAGGDSGSITESTYIQNPMYKKFHVHLVTMPYDFYEAGVPNVCTDLYGGKGYGKFETEFGNTSRWRDLNPPNPGHYGYDVYAKVGDKVFAFHGGEAVKVDNGTHHMCKIDWSRTLGQNNITFLHLSEHVACKDVNKINVIAGQIVAKSGRSGNFPDISPSHVHLNVGVTIDLGHKYLPLLTEALKTHYADNEICIPNNEFPLVFPCCCEVIDPNPKNCHFADLNFLRNCWAAAELKCPHINPADKGNIKLQVQLRHIKEVTAADPGGFSSNPANNPEYYHPGIIDGIIGNDPVNVNTANLTNGKVVQILPESSHEGKLIKIKHTQDDGQVREGWIESSLIDADHKLAIPGWAGTNSLSNLIENSVGSTRMAIYFFKKANGLLSFNDYAANFIMNDIAWTTLNNIAPVTLPE